MSSKLIGALRFRISEVTHGDRDLDADIYESVMGRKIKRVFHWKWFDPECARWRSMGYPTAQRGDAVELLPPGWCYESGITSDGRGHARIWTGRQPSIRASAATEALAMSLCVIAAHTDIEG